MDSPDRAEDSSFSLDRGTLYVVATPLGNLGDITFRCQQAFRKADAVACEDTRVTSRLLQRLNIDPVPTLFSYRDENEAQKAPEILEELQQGKSIVLAADAGTPTISDPGFRLVRACRKAGIPVIPLPGPSAAITALSVSGCPTDQFLFVGFLPPKKAARQRFFEEHHQVPYTLVFYESTHRIEKFLDDLEATLGPDRTLFLAREMTKLHETYLAGTVQTVKSAFARGSKKGEFVICVARDGFTL